MNETVMLAVEKEQYEQMLAEYHKQPNLGFKKVAESAYRVYNKSTERFYNHELGIDWVI